VTELIPRKVTPLIAHYLQFLTQRNFAEAERELGAIKQEMKSTQWHKGYYNALEGMLISLKSSDNRYLYITRINHNDNKKIDELQKLFLRLARNPLQGDFDNGFFTAWAEYLRVLKSERPGVKSLNEYLPLFRGLRPSSSDKICIKEDPKSNPHQEIRH